MYFFVRANNPRPTFLSDMTDAERDIMQRHIAYLSGFAARGEAVVFGPVLDPAGVFGMGVYDVADEAAMRAILADDPGRELLTFDVLPMPRAVVGRAKANVE